MGKEGGQRGRGKGDKKPGTHRADPRESVPFQLSRKTWSFWKRAARSGKAGWRPMVVSA